MMQETRGRVLMPTAASLRDLLFPGVRALAPKLEIAGAEIGLAVDDVNRRNLIVRFWEPSGHYLDAVLFSELETRIRACRIMH